MNKIEVRPGVTMAYEDHWFGEPWTSPEPVVMIHGNSESSRAWTCWVPQLARHYRVIRPDLPGFGASPEPADYGWTAAELAAEHATDADFQKLRDLVAEAEGSLGDAERFTRLGAAFHLAVAEASHNRVLVVQLISLQHVSWPRRNPTLTATVARRIVDVHKELLSLIEMRDAAGARRLMDDHVKMIRARRVTEDAKAKHMGSKHSGSTDSGVDCC